MQGNAVTRLGLLLLLVVPGISCSYNTRKAIIYSESADPLVSNGTAFDRATLDVGENRVVVVPPDAQVDVAESPGTVTILMKKRMGIGAHPPKSISIDEARNEMGCAYIASDGKLRIAKYGEFLCPEGGRNMDLTIRVPKGIRVEKDNREMELPEGKTVAQSPLQLHRTGDQVWCAVDNSNLRWTPIPDQPDKESCLAMRSRKP